MSWNVTVTGTPEKVAAIVNDEPHMPAEVKSLIGGLVAQMKPTLNADKPIGVFVRTSGHLWEGVGNLNLELGYTRI